MFGLVVVNSTVDFENQPVLGTVEICDDAFDRMLTPKFQAIQPPSTQVMPELRLGRSGFPSQFSCPLAQLMRAADGFVLHSRSLFRV